MKNFLILCGIVIFMVQGCQSPDSSRSKSSSDLSYTIDGKIAGLDSGWVYLMDLQSENRTTDSVRIKNGNFTFTGRADTPHYCLLGIPNPAEHDKEYRLGFFVENGRLNISGNRDSIDKAAVTGSGTEDEYKGFKAGRKSIEDEEMGLGMLYDSMEKKGDKMMLDSLQKMYNLLGLKQKEFVKEYVKNHPASYIAAFEVYREYSYNPDARELDTVYNNLSLSIQNSYYGKKIKNVLDIAKKTAVGNAAPDFTQNDVAGRPVSLSSFKGKYLLVDFWASWCGPCRAENPNVVGAFSKFHRKGFDVLGVSLDDQKDKWQEAVKKDKLDWTQVSDLQGWKNSVAVLYGIQGIPMNFLLDKNGKIIAKSLRGTDLEKKLGEVLQ